MFRLIDAEKTSYSIARMTALLKVSRSGYYKWAAAETAGPGPAAVRRAALDVKVARFHAASDQVYGSPRILADLREDGETVSRKTVAASMRRQHLQGISPRRFTPITTIADRGRPRSADLVERGWDTGELDRVWTSDITYLPTGQGWVYLCAVRDGLLPPGDRLGHGRAHAHLAGHRRAGHGGGLSPPTPPKVIFHADRGTQFTSTQMAEYADLHGLACSVGRTGVCWDNAQQESYWASLKVEFYNRRTWPTRAAAITAIGDWIERVYNRRRRHSALHMLTPVLFEQLHRQLAKAA